MYKCWNKAFFFSDGYVDDDEEDDAIQKVARKIFKRINWDMWSKK